MPKMADRRPLCLVLLLFIGVFTLTNAEDKQKKCGRKCLKSALDKLSLRVDSLQAKIGSLGQTVAFYAGNSDLTMTIAPDGTVVLDTAFTNVGNGYDNTTGVFTAPVSGLYEFQAMFMQKDWAGKAIYASIKLDGRQVARGVADNRGGSWDLASTRAIVQVTSGQKVTLANGATAAGKFYGGTYTRFSGFLIKAD